MHPFLVSSRFELALVIVGLWNTFLTYRNYIQGKWKQQYKKVKSLFVYISLPKYATVHFVIPGNSNLSAVFWNDAVFCGGGVMFCGSTGATLPSPKWQLDGCCFSTEWDLHCCGHRGPLSSQTLLRTTNKNNYLIFYIPLFTLGLYDFIFSSH